MFSLCHIRHLNLVNRHPERLTKEDKRIINDLDYEGVEFPVSKKKIIAKLKGKTIFAFMCVVMKMD